MRAAYSQGLLRDPGFDFAFVVGTAALALFAGLLVNARPEVFWLVFTLDLWLLGYHHVAATYTRLAFDLSSFRENRRLVIHLPIAVAVLTVAFALAAGLWILATIYLYWQWFHYARQSEGIAKAYAGKAGEKDLGPRQLTRAVHYAIPLAGILHVSARSPDEFLFMPVRVLPVPDALVVIADAVAVALLAVWLGFQVRAWLNRRLAVPFFCYSLSHVAVFAVGYIALTQINYGWLTINIWHNAQYLLFVWLFNNRRFRGKLDPAAPFLSSISQNGRFLLYVGVCLTISTSVYFLINRFGIGALATAIGVSIAAATVIVYQTVNFHHYIVDAIIWKLRKPAIRAKLGLS